MARQSPPIHELPPGYREAYHLVLLEPGKVLLVNLLALIPLAVGFVAMLGWITLINRLRGPYPGGPDWPWWTWIVLVFVIVIPLHEWLHGQAIHWTGHRPRYGMMLSKGAFYATADHAFFRRDEYVVIALAPLVGITLLGAIVTVFLPDSAAYYTGLAVALNAGSAIGDLWMTVVVLRYPASALVKDEADSLRVYISH
jgi:hypothetical protein